jgi:ABC-type sulfate transport system substrate-binding protein
MDSSTSSNHSQTKTSAPSEHKRRLVAVIHVNLKIQHFTHASGKEVTAITQYGASGTPQRCVWVDGHLNNIEALSYINTINRLKD